MIGYKGKPNNDSTLFTGLPALHCVRERGKSGLKRVWQRAGTGHQRQGTLTIWCPRCCCSMPVRAVRVCWPSRRALKKTRCGSRAAASTHVFRFSFKRYQTVRPLVKNPAEFLVQNHLRQSARGGHVGATTTEVAAALLLHHRLVHVNEVSNVADLNARERLEKPDEILEEKDDENRGGGSSRGKQQPAPAVRHIAHPGERR